MTFRIVGIATDPVTFPPIPGQFRPFLRLSPAFYERYVADLTRNDVLFVDLSDVTDLDTFKADVAQVSGGTPAFYGITQADHTTNVQRTLHLAAIVLWLLAGLIAVATAMTGLQALSRQAYVDSIDHPVLRTLGMTRSERLGVGLVRTIVVAASATVVAVAVAILLSPLWPIGLARVAEPSPGMDVNVAVIGTGAVAVALLVLLVGAGTSWRWTRFDGRGSRLARARVHPSSPGCCRPRSDRSPSPSAPARRSTVGADAPRCRCARRSWRRRWPSPRSRPR